MNTRYGLQIRAPEAQDASGLADLFLSAGHAVDAGALAGRLQALARSPGIALIAQEWGPPSGLVTLHWYPVLVAEQPAARMTLLLVAPEARRRGLGRLLLKSASQAARVAGCDTLECFTTQTTLTAFLLATGFVQEETRFLRPLRRKSQG